MRARRSGTRVPRQLRPLAPPKPERCIRRRSRHDERRRLYGPTDGRIRKSSHPHPAVESRSRNPDSARSLDWVRTTKCRLPIGRERLRNDLVHIIISVGREPADEHDILLSIRQRFIALEK
jgi:hypothetical protein